MGLTQASQETDGKILNHDRCQGTQSCLHYATILEMINYVWELSLKYKSEDSC